MNARIPDQAERLRQLAASESNVNAVLDELPLPTVEPVTTIIKETAIPETVSTLAPNRKTKKQKRNASFPATLPLETPDPIETSSETTTPGDRSPLPEETISPADIDNTNLTSLLMENPVSDLLKTTDILEDRVTTEPVQEERARVTPLMKGRRFPLAQSTQVIAITGGKGGVGKSNIACNLAIAMAQMNKRVLVFDADLSLANVDVLMGLSPRFNLNHVIRGEKELHEIIVEGPGGIRIIPGGSGVEELSQLDSPDMQRLFNAFDDIQPAPDIFLIDTAAGIYPNVMQFLTAADQVIVVTTPEPTAYTDAYALIKTLLKHQDGKEIGLLINMVQNAREAAEVLRLMLQMCRQFLNLSFNNIGFVPRDPEVLKAVRYQKPFLLRTPNSPASQTIRNIAATILQIDLKNREPRGLRKFFHRIFSSSPAKAAV